MEWWWLFPAVWTGGFLLWAANEAQKSSGGRLLAITTASPSVPRKDIDDAREFAGAIGVDWEVFESSEFSHEEYLRNDKLRCYHCKAELFRITDGIIRERGFHHVAYGIHGIGYWRLPTGAPSGARAQCALSTGGVGNREEGDSPTARTRGVLPGGQTGQPLSELSSDDGRGGSRRPRSRLSSPSRPFCGMAA